MFGCAKGRTGIEADHVLTAVEAICTPQLVRRCLVVGCGEKLHLAIDMPTSRRPGKIVVGVHDRARNSATLSVAFPCRTLRQQARPTMQRITNPLAAASEPG